MKYVPNSVLKYIAYISMFIDHLAILLNRNMLVESSTYMVMRGIGRLAFPLFLWFLVEGVHNTKSKPKYLLRMASLAILSEVPYDLYFYGGFPNWEHQNVFFELFVCLVLLILFQRFLPCNQGGESCAMGSRPDTYLTESCANKKEMGFCPAYIVFFTLIMCIPAYFLHFTYGFKGVIATAFLYKFYQEREKQRQSLLLQLLYLCLSCASLVIQSTKIQYACIAVIPLILFSNSTLRSQSKALQIALYFFYPVHILLLYAAERLFA